MLVDTLGLLLARHVHPADLSDREGAERRLAPLAGRFPRLELVRIEGGDQGQFQAWVGEELGWRAEVVQHPDPGVRHAWLPTGAPPPPRPQGFGVLPRRWIVDRTFAWLGGCRRLGKDDEALPGRRMPG